MWVALATSSKQLHLVQCQLNWGLSQETMKGAVPAGQQLNPSFTAKHVAITSWLSSNTSESPSEHLATHISVLEFVPGTFDQLTKTWHWPYILTVRSFVPTAETPYSQEAQSIIDRWEVTSDQPQNLHPAFENLGSRRNSTGNAPPVSVHATKGPQGQHISDSSCSRLSG